MMGTAGTQLVTTTLIVAKVSKLTRLKNTARKIPQKKARGECQSPISIERWCVELGKNPPLNLIAKK